VVERAEEAGQVERVVEGGGDRGDQPDAGGDAAQRGHEHQRLLRADRPLGAEPQQVGGEQEVDLRLLGPLGDEARDVERGTGRVDRLVVDVGTLAARSGHGLERPGCFGGHGYPPACGFTN
jgi:hypothetical protein